LYDLDANYFENSVSATLANREFCLDNAANFKTYQKNFWGLSACLGPKGYKAYGAKPGRGFHDGTIAPYAILSSLVFTPEESLSTIEEIYINYKDQIYGKYGFRDGLNIDKNWFAKSYIGIDQGATIGMIENYRSGLIWKLFMSLESTKRWIRLCNLTNKAFATKPGREVKITKISPKKEAPKTPTLPPTSSAPPALPTQPLTPLAKKPLSPALAQETSREINLTELSKALP